MKYLILDTSSDLCLIALVEGKTLLSQELFPHENLLSKKLLPTIQQTLEKQGWLPSDLEMIAVGNGPGSYTGTRLGVAVAKGLAFGLSIPLKPFSSPLAFLPTAQGKFSFLIPTRAGLFFHLKGVCSADAGFQESAALIQPEALVSEIADADFLVCPEPQSLPDGLKPPCHPALPNLIGLCSFLPGLKPALPEAVELQYLHVPT